jgi:hypothetical protein
MDDEEKIDRINNIIVEYAPPTPAHQCSYEDLVEAATNAFFALSEIAEVLSK